jgi:F-type H+-transporting ATPase subunit a
VSTSKRFLIGTAAIGAALYAILSLAFARFLPEGAGGGLDFGLFVSIANVVASYFLLLWGARHGDRQFMLALAGGMLGRFLVLGLALFVAHEIPALGFRSTLFTVLAAFFPLAGYEVFCVVRELERGRAARGSSAPDQADRATRTDRGGLATIACAGAAIVAALLWAGPARASDPPSPPSGHDAHGASSDPHAAPAPHEPAGHDAAATHATGDAHHSAEGEHGDGDIFGHLFHHLQDEVVFPLPVVQLGTFPLDISITKLVLMIWLACAINIVVFVTLARKSAGLVPAGRFQNLFESLVIFVKKDMVEEIMGHHLGAKYTPYFLTIFFFILVMNLLGLVPFLHTATGNIAVTASLAVLTFLLMQIAGIREQGLGHYLKSIVPPGIPLWLYPIMIPVEVLGQFTKPFALTIRLFANMTAGHVVILSLFGIIFTFKALLGPILTLGIVAPVMVGFVLFVDALELLVAFLQAYIFTFLSILFVNACAHPEH